MFNALNAAAVGSNLENRQNLKQISNLNVLDSFFVFTQWKDIVARGVPIMLKHDNNFILRLIMGPELCFWVVLSISKKSICKRK